MWDRGRDVSVPHQLTFFSNGRKSDFLERLKVGKNRYRRYLGSPLRYAGGKSWAVGYVVEHLPENVKKLVSPFFGGGSIEIAVSKELGIQVLGFDIFDILVNYWQVQIKFPLELFNELERLKPTKEVYAQVKEDLKKHWKGEIKLPPIKLAAYYL
jgi:site-specific DNA-adenine methylase